VPTAAILRARADDDFWAARRVVAINEELIRAMVKTGRYSQASDEQLLGDILVQRRNKIAQAYLNAVNPLVDFALSADGQLTFKNAAIDAGVGRPPASGYQGVWASLDNETDVATQIAPTTGTGLSLPAPPNLPSAAGAYVKVSVAAVGAEQATWNQPVDVYFRRTASGWQLVGLDRIRPESN
jgi:hypothetical protein